MNKMESTRKLTNLQIELLKIFRFNISDDQVKEIRSMLATYFAEKVSSEMDALFEANNWDAKKKLRSGQKSTCVPNMRANEGCN